MEGMIVHFLFQHTAIGVLNEAVVGKLKTYQRGGVLCNLLLNWENLLPQPAVLIEF